MQTYTLTQLIELSDATGVRCAIPVGYGYNTLTPEMINGIFSDSAFQEVRRTLCGKVIWFKEISRY